MKSVIEIKSVSDAEIDGECIPLCPYCDQPIFGGAIIIQHQNYGSLALAHESCANEEQ